MARTPKPPSIHIAAGTHRADRHGDPETLGSDVRITELPKPEKGACAEFKKRWSEYGKRMIQAGTLTERDLPALEALCAAHVELKDAFEVLKSEGRYVVGMQGVVRHPAMTSMEKARAFIRLAQIDLGFSPVGRAKVPAQQTAAAGKPRVSGMNRKSN